MCDRGVEGGRARPTAGSPVDRKAAPEATVPAAMPRLATFLPGRLSGALPSTPCSLPKATAEPVRVTAPMKVPCGACGRGCSCMAEMSQRWRIITSPWNITMLPLTSQTSQSLQCSSLASAFDW